MIVGIGFNMRVGKDTAAMALSRELGFKRVGFADALKELALRADPLITTGNRAVNIGVGHGRLKWTVQGLGGWDKAKETYPEVRTFLQNLGLGAREVFGDDFWTNQVMAPAVSRDRAGLHTVIPDVRFLNEAEAIKEAGGFLIKLTRPGYGGDGHVSETQLAEYDGWDVVIENTGSIVELEASVIQTVRDAMPPKMTWDFLDEELQEAAASVALDGETRS
jgi:hypothetical protein